MPRIRIRIGSSPLIQHNIPHRSSPAPQRLFDPCESRTQKRAIASRTSLSSPAGGTHSNSVLGCFACNAATSSGKSRRRWPPWPRKIGTILIVSTPAATSSPRRHRGLAASARGMRVAPALSRQCPHANDQRLEGLGPQRVAGPVCEQDQTARHGSCRSPIRERVARSIKASSLCLNAIT